MMRVSTLLLLIWSSSAIGAPNGQQTGVDQFSSVVLTAGGCLDGTKVAEIGCYRYKECIEGVWVTRTCPGNQLFSEGKCRVYTEVECDRQVCTIGTKTAYPQDCRKYLLCDENHKQVVENCPTSDFPKIYDYVFDPATSECEKVWAWKAENCGTAVAVGGSGLKSAFPQDCQKYLAYQDDKQVVVDCPTSNFPYVYKYVFNPASSECERIWAWKLGDCVKSASGQKSTENGPTRSIREVVNPDDCIEDDTKYDTRPGVCSTYMYCHNGRWTRRSCEKGKFYNDETKECGTDSCPFEAVPGNCEAFRSTKNADVFGKCDFGMIFDKFKNECVEFASGTCAEIECEGLERKNHPSNCGRYLQCKNQQWLKKSCGWFQNEFDIESRTCVFGWFTDRAATCRYDPAECAEGLTIPVGNDCRRYVICKDKSLQEHSCIWPKKFDTSSSKCVWWGAQCS
ncbi:chitin Hypothetical protein [Nesidiocoris tenuis]|uniref:Chitin-binding type-2 domain-containing protein n=1 Tax=Nesidiocoris tenuis TaxID=355587 RepID=A0ABN7BB74_9HEMI|nr:chitin Hypothetical protein [Nesidiocoris tenuis]